MADPVVRYFADYAVGAVFDCGSVAVDEASIVAFAKEYDPQPFHTSIRPTTGRSAG